MNCYKCKKIIDNMHNDCINNNELQSMLHHIEQCSECRQYYNVMEEILKDLASLEEKELPKGFENKLHFALKREAETNKKPNSKLSGRLKLAAIGAFSVLLVLAAVSILPNRMMNDMVMEEAMEAPAEIAQNEIAIMETKEESAEEPMTGSYSATDSAREACDEDALVCDKAAEAECEQMLENASPEDGFLDGDSIVLVLDVENPDTAYEDLIEFFTLMGYFTDPLPDSSWVLTEIEEPGEYRQVRIISGVNEAEYISSMVAKEYEEYIVEFFITHAEYDDYQTETADLQNIGYVFIVLH